MESMPEMKVAIGWDGLPHYGAAAIAAGIERLGRPLPVIGTRAAVPFKGLEERLGQPIHWVERSDRPSWEDLGLEVPDLFLHTGWAYPVFKHLADAVLARGGKIVVFVDNNWSGSARQWLGSVYFRLFLRRRFAGAWVPGRSGARFCRVLGVPASRIYEGLYGADPQLYRSETPLARRPKRFLFVGQLIHRKGVDLMLEDFARFHRNHPDWRLHCIGNGVLADAVQGPGITRAPFSQADAIAREMSASRFLVLPSRSEHWGLVVHEAALSGCGLLLSNQVGAADDLATPENAFRFDARPGGGMEAAFAAAAALNDEELKRAERASLREAARFGPRAFADSLERIVTDLS